MEQEQNLGATHKMALGEENVSEENEVEAQVEIIDSNQEIETLQKQVEENYELFLRARADLENYRRRARKEREEAVKYAGVPLIEALLPVLDNFERALKASDQTEDQQTLQQGVEMVYRQLTTALSDAGLTVIETAGQEFDPHLHHAVMNVEDESLDSGMIVEEFQPGYRYHDRVIRPSMVKVST